MKITSYRIDDVRFQKQAIVSANTVYVLANKSKIPASALFSVGSVYDVDVLVSDANFDQGALKKLRERNVEIVQA